MTKRKAEQLKKENKRIHKNTVDYFKEKDKNKKLRMRFREIGNN